MSRVIIPIPKSRPIERVRNDGHLLATLGMVGAWALGILAGYFPGPWIMLFGVVGFLGLWITISVGFHKINPWREPHFKEDKISEEERGKILSMVESDRGRGK